MCRVCQCLDKELVVIFLFYMPGITAIYFQVADFQVAQVAKGIKPAAKVINAAATADSGKTRYCLACLPGISQHAIFGEFHEQVFCQGGRFTQSFAEPLYEVRVVQ